MQSLTWKLLTLAATANAMGSTITSLILQQEKMERARNQATSFRPRPLVSGSVSLTIEDIIRLVNSAEKTASLNRVDRKSGRVNRHQSESNKANMRRLKNFKAHYRFQKRVLKEDIKTFNKLQRKANQYKETGRI